MRRSAAELASDCTDASVERRSSSATERQRDRDHRGSRRLGPLEQTVWYLVAGVSYVVVGVYHKWVLNWIVGPAWLVAVLVIGPWLTDTLRAMLRRRRDV